MERIYDQLIVGGIGEVEGGVANENYISLTLISKKSGRRKVILK